MECLNGRSRILRRSADRPARRPTDQAPNGRANGPTGGRRGPEHDEGVGGFRADMAGGSEGFPKVSEGSRVFRQLNRRREMFENVRRCPESWIRGRRRRPGQQTPIIILNKEIQDASSNFNTSDVANGAWAKMTSGLLEFYQPRFCTRLRTRLLFDSLISITVIFSSLVFVSSYIVFSRVAFPPSLISSSLLSPYLIRSPLF